MKRGRRDYMSKGRVKIMIQKPTETADLSLWELMGYGWTARESPQD